MLKLKLLIPLTLLSISLYANETVDKQLLACENTYLTCIDNKIIYKDNYIYKILYNNINNNYIINLFYTKIINKKILYIYITIYKKFNLFTKSIYNRNGYIIGSILLEYFKNNLNSII